MRFHVALTLGMLLAGQSSGCETPAGFVNPPRPDIAPLEQLLSHTEEIDIARPLAAAAQSANHPLQEAILPTKDLPGVSGTFRLSNGPYGSVGARRLVCLTDGSMAVEEVLLTESNGNSSRFRYVVWNYTSPKFRDVSHAVGEIARTQPSPDKTHVNWTYRFALKTDGKSQRPNALAKSRFRVVSRALCNDETFVLTIRVSIRLEIPNQAHSQHANQQHQDSVITEVLFVRIES